MLMSRRPIATTRGRSSGRLSNTVGRPSGSRAVVTRPRGLWNSHSRVRSRAGSGSPSTVILSLSVTLTAGEFEHRAVERDAAFGDHRLGVAARRDAGAGDHLGDAVLLRRLRLRLRGGGALVAGAAAIGPAVVPAVVGHAGLIAEPEWRGERTRTTPARRRSIRWAWRSPRRAPRQHGARCRSAPSSSRTARSSPRRGTAPARSRIPRPMPRCWRSAPPARRSATSASRAATST